MPNREQSDALKRTTAINILLGMWLFLFGAYGNMASPDSWSVGIAGGLIALFAAMRFWSPEQGRIFSILNMLLGGWVLISPWVMGYADDSTRLVNSLLAGLAVLGFGLYGATTGGRTSSQDHREASA